MTEAERLAGLRARALELGDRNLVAEVDAYAQRRGVDLGEVTPPPLEEKADPAPLERVVRTKRS